MQTHGSGPALSWPFLSTLETDKDVRVTRVGARGAIGRILAGVILHEHVEARYLSEVVVKPGQVRPVFNVRRETNASTDPTAAHDQDVPGIKNERTRTRLRKSGLPATHAMAPKRIVERTVSRYRMRRCTKEIPARNVSVGKCTRCMSRAYGCGCAVRHRLLLRCTNWRSYAAICAEKCSRGGPGAAGLRGWYLRYGMERCPRPADSSALPRSELYGKLA